jgi:allantoinase
MMIDLCREYRCPVHIVHLSAAKEAKPLIKKAKVEGLPFTVETCPHYLAFAAEGILDGDPVLKCAPPIRNESQQGALRAMVATGLINTLGSDHSPAPPKIKHLIDGDFREAWGGIASVQLLLPATWTALGDLMRIGQFANLLTAQPAELVGLVHRKGKIASEHDADLVVFSPDAEFEVTLDGLHHRHKATPYTGKRLRGVVERTYLRGRKVYEWGEFVGGPFGQMLRRDTSAQPR